MVTFRFSFTWRVRTVVGVADLVYAGTETVFGESRVSLQYLAQYLDALGEFGGVFCVSLALCGVLGV